VQTNYGTSPVENVFINIEGHSAPVYALGAKAKTWSNDAEPDAQGFYPLSMPNAYSLSPRLDGFTAKIRGGETYYVGAYDVSSTNTKLLSTTVIQKEDFSNVQSCTKQMCCAYTRKDTDKDSWKRDFVSFVRLANNGRISYKTSIAYRSDGSSGNWQNASAKQSNNLDITIGGYKLPEEEYSAGTSWLINNGEAVMSLTFSTSYSNFTYSASSTQLGYRAIKMFKTSSKSPFKYLSENYYLDNDPSKFKLGNIKDAWEHYHFAYVQTENNSLYEYYNGSWVFCGYFDVQKIQIPIASSATTNSTYSVLMLTKDGRLFHKGKALKNITEEHTDFTEIFPGNHFYDFVVAKDSAGSGIAVTSCATTLTVIKE